ncbi:MAG: hypothetical protein JSS20_15225 [Proteobacteria bacterium]|nr:hypothetical protein [Pseudomonadota bacterium]
MSEVTSEMVMAYIDDELEPAERPRVEKAIAANPALQALAERYRLTGKAVRESFGEIEVPQHLIDFVRSYEAPTAEAAPEQAKPANVVTLPQSRRTTAAPSPFMRLAASVLLLLAGTGTGWLLRDRQAASDAQHAANHRDRHLTASVADTLQSALETSAGGSTAKLGTGAATITVGSTFQDLGHRYCRQYRLVLGDDAPIDGVACRRQSGDWVSELVGRATPSSARSPSMATAGRNDTNPFDRERDNMMSGGVLDDAEVRLLIAGKWAVTLPER